MFWLQSVNGFLANFIFVIYHCFSLTLFCTEHLSRWNAICNWLTDAKIHWPTFWRIPLRQVKRIPELPLVEILRLPALTVPQSEHLIAGNLGRCLRVFPCRKQVREGEQWCVGIGNTSQPLNSPTKDKVWFMTLRRAEFPNQHFLTLCCWKIYMPNANWASILILITYERIYKLSASWNTVNYRV
jgi:hypothetical protein